MSTLTEHGSTPPTRRERQRAATYDEIVQVSRRLLRSSTEDLSLRAVATEMGITPPALYRYVDGYAELLQLIARSIFDDVVARMVTERDRYPIDDPAAQIVAVATAFRGWALGNPEEFRMAFAAPMAARVDPTTSTSSSSTEAATATTPTATTATATTPTATTPTATTATAGSTYCATGTDTGADQFAAVFSEIFARLYAAYRFPIPADEDLDPDVLAVLRDEISQSEVAGELGAISAGMIWTFERAWSRLYGIVALEVFGHLHPEFIRSGAMYTATMRDMAAELGMMRDWERLQDIAGTGPA